MLFRDEINLGDYHENRKGNKHFVKQKLQDDYDYRFSYTPFITYK